MNNYKTRRAGLRDLADLRQIMKDNHLGSAEDALKLLNRKGLKAEPSLFMVDYEGNCAGFVLLDRCSSTMIQVDWQLKNEFKHLNLGTILTRSLSQYVNDKGYDCLVTFRMDDLVKLSIVRKLGFTRVDSQLPQITYLKKCG